MSNYEFHLISDGKKSLEEFARIASVVQPFLTSLHLREKNKTAIELWEGIDLLHTAGVPREKIIVNDRVDVAMASGISGVQLAYHSLEPKWVKQFLPRLRVGRSVHSSEEAKAMEQQGTDFLIYGHIFTSGSKLGLRARGLHALYEVVRSVKIPVIAIGGISPDRVGQVIQTGVAGIAVMSGILDAVDPVVTAKQYGDALWGGTPRHEQKL